MVTQFVQHVVPSVVKPARVLWNEIIGFLFLLLSLAGAPTGIKEFRRFQDSGSTDNLFRCCVAVVFALLMLGFGVASLRRARKIARS